MTDSVRRRRSSKPTTFDTDGVGRTLGIAPARVRALVRAGVGAPERDGRRLRFSFQDVVLLRAALGLVNAKVPLARLQRSLGALARQLSPHRPLSGVRVYADRKHVVARTGKTVWQPESGQLLFSFAVDELARVAGRVAAIRPVGPSRSKSEAINRARAVVLFDRAVRCETRHDVKGAENAYRQALELDPQLANAYINLGRLLHNSDMDEAARLYSQALELAPDDPIVHYNLALVYEDKFHVGAAISQYQRALDHDPDFADAHFNVARLLERSGQRNQALRHLLTYKRLTEG